MKNFIYSILAISVITLFARCNTGPTYDFKGTTDINIFIDITDSLYKDFNEYENDIEGILEKMDLDVDNGGLAGGKIQFFLLDETSSKPAGVVTISQAKDDPNDPDSNPFFRADLISEFKTELSQNWQQILNDVDWEKDNSKIYQQLCRELNKMTKFSKAEQQIFIVYSDMLEHSELFSFYGKGYNRVKRWMEDKDRLKMAYSREISTDCELPSIEEGIDNVEVYFVAKRTAYNDEKVNLAEKFWAYLLTEKGIKKVHFGADLVFR